MTRKLLIRFGVSFLSVATLFTWWTFGTTGRTVPSQNTIPEKIGNGGHMLEIVAESTSPATMHVSFEDFTKPAGEQTLLDSWQKIPAGLRSWMIDVPAGVGGYIELDADQPKVGDTVTMRVGMNGQLVDKETSRLDQPLDANTAFFVQDHFDDYSAATPDEDADR
jgi:hypothetical protein